MLDAKQFKVGDPIYTFVDDDGTNVHIASEQLRIWCIARDAAGELERFWTPTDLKLANKMLKDNTVLMNRVLALTPRHLETPIIYAKTNTHTKGRPDVLLVDGHHRFVRACVEGRPFILAWVVERASWEEFQIDGLPSISQNLLRAMPHKVRNY
jgi:hypothetical protein